MLKSLINIRLEFQILNKSGFRLFLCESQILFDYAFCHLEIQLSHIPYTMFPPLSKPHFSSISKSWSQNQDNWWWIDPFSLSHFFYNIYKMNGRGTWCIIQSFFVWMIFRLYNRITKFMECLCSYPLSQIYGWL